MCKLVWRKPLFTQKPDQYGTWVRNAKGNDAHMAMEPHMIMDTTTHIWIENM